MIKNRHLTALENIVGTTNIISQENLTGYNSFYNIKSQIICVVKFYASDKLAEVFKYLKKLDKNYKTIIISGKGNIGYNNLSSTELQVKYFIIDLTTLNRILSFNSEFGFVEIEPGVSYLQLYQYLAINAPDYITTGMIGGDDTSITANALQRGVGIGRFCDRKEHVKPSEFIDATGRFVMLSDYAENNNFSISSKLQSVNYAMDYSSMLFQNDDIIVTKLIVYLQKIPEYSATINISISNEQLSELLPLIGEHIESEIINSSLYVVSENFLLATYVNQHMFNQDNNSIVENNEFGFKQRDWNTLLFISGHSREMLEAKIVLIKQIFVNYPLEQDVTIYKKSTVQELIRLSANKNDGRYKNFFNILMFHGFVPKFVTDNILLWDIYKPVRDFSENYRPYAFFPNFIVANIPEYIEQARLVLEQCSAFQATKICYFWQFRSPSVLILVIPLIYQMDSESELEDVLKLKDYLFKKFSEQGFKPYRGFGSKEDFGCSATEEIEVALKKIFNPYIDKHIS